MKHRTGRLLAAAVLAVGGSVAMAAPAQAGGGVDITGWCRWYYNSGAFNAMTVANNVYGWRCQYGTDAGALPLPVLSEDFASGEVSGDRGKAPGTALQRRWRLSYRRRQGTRNVLGVQAR